MFGRPGQVVVEMLLILPVFLTLVFGIMEMGHLAFWVLVINHATYECARIGAMLATTQSGGTKDVTSEMQQRMSVMVLNGRIQSHTESTIQDRQANVTNQDLVVTGSTEVKLVFPITSLIMSEPKGSGRRILSATVRMPIERPLSQ